jgi:hypothetical protein
MAPAAWTRKCTIYQKIDVHTATLDEPDAFPPVREIWLEDKIAWMATNDRFTPFPRTSKG